MNLPMTPQAALACIEDLKRHGLISYREDKPEGPSPAMRQAYSQINAENVARERRLLAGVTPITAHTVWRKLGLKNAKSASSWVQKREQQGWLVRTGTTQNRTGAPLRLYRWKVDEKDESKGIDAP